MPKVTVKIDKNFTTIPNEILKNREMSLKAKGLLITMLSLPEEWNYTVEGLSKILKEGRDSIRAALSELEEFSYLKRERKRDSRGQLSEIEYFVYQYPIKMGSEPITENPTLDKPTLENPTLEKPTQLRNNVLNKDILNKDTELNTDIDKSNTSFPKEKEGHEKSNTSFQEGKEGRGNTFSPEKGTYPLKEKDYVHKNHITEYTQEQLEKHISSRVEYYMEKDHLSSREDDDEVEQLEKIILYFYERYYKQTGKRHPIISDYGYRKIVDAYMKPPDVMHELAVYEFEYYKPMIDKYFETDFNARGKFNGKIELSLSHFMSDRIREYLFYQTDY